MTILSRLWEKGELTRRREGRAYAYEPVVSREQRIAQRMQAVLGAAEDHALALNAFADALPDDQRNALRKALGRRGAQRLTSSSRSEASACPGCRGSLIGGA